MEFAEAGYHDILAGFEGLFYDFQQNLGGFGRLIPGIAISFLDRFSNIGFCECIRHFAFSL